MIEPIQDCQILIARGMGGGAFSHLQEAGIQALLTEHEDVASALRAYQAGELEHRPERLHARGGGHGHEGEH